MSEKVAKEVSRNDLSHRPTRILRKTTVLDRVGICNSSLHNFINRGEFPKAIRLGGGRAVGWLEHEVDAWIDARIAASRNAASHEGSE